MLKPVQALTEVGIVRGWGVDDVRRKQEKLLEALLNPMQPQEHCVIETFAHGPELLRVAAIGANYDRHAHWAVQLWSVFKEDWITEKGYDMTPIMKQSAIEDAKNWYPPMSQSEAVSKWSDVCDDEEIIDSRAKLAEFWYETKVVEWDTRYASEPWGFMSLVADTTFRRNGIPDPLLGEKFVKKIETQIANFSLIWGESLAPILSGTFCRPSTNELVALKQFWSVEEATNALLDSDLDVTLRLVDLTGKGSPERFHYCRSSDGALSREGLSQALESFIGREESRNLTVGEEDLSAASQALP